MKPRVATLAMLMLTVLPGRTGWMPGVIQANPIFYPHAGLT